MQSQEAASLGIVQCISFKESPVVVDARKLETHTAEVSLSLVKATFSLWLLGLPKFLDPLWRILMLINIYKGKKNA